MKSIGVSLGCRSRSMVVLCGVLSVLALVGCQAPNVTPGPVASASPSADQAQPSPTPSPTASPAQNGARVRQITILATNDIHGGVESQTTAQGDTVGGLALFSGIVKATREGLNKRLGDNAGIVVVDSGDQFQGTLISNYDEGQLVFSAMNAVGYDAAITGNHDYDFGPVGWLDDQVNSSNPDKDPRGALRRLVKLAQFPIISANTFYKSSIVDTSGNPVDVGNSGCRPKAGTAQIDWSRAQSPDFLKPYLIKTVAGGVRVALIGIDNPETPTTTTPANVSDLCFEDEFDAYARVRRSLEGKADVFIMLLHDGNSSNEFGATDLLKKIEAMHVDGPGAPIDAILAGHTHYINHVMQNGVPLIQDGAWGERYGRIDLFFDTQTGKVLTDKTVSLAGIDIALKSCDAKAKAFCAAPAAGAASVSIEGEPLTQDPAVLSLIADARARIAPLATRKVGHDAAKIVVDRIAESPLADALTDSLREISGAEVAMMNTGGIRAPLPEGDVTYEDFFKVLPFANHGVVVGPMPADKLVALLQKSITTCGNFGALMQSGLDVTFSRDCSHATNGLDPKAALVTVSTVTGEQLFDVARGGLLAPKRTFQVATLDFLSAGGSGFDGFIGTPVERDMGIVREAMANAFFSKPFAWDAKVDGRWKQETAPAQ